LNNSTNDGRLRGSGVAIEYGKWYGGR